jgi:hypothetical protein
MNQLLKTLLERNLILTDSVLVGQVRANTLGGILKKIRKEVYYTKLSMKGFVCHDGLGKKYLMALSDLESIDGMDLARYARVYNIKADGSRAKDGKKRGRKPKHAINNCTEA